MFLYRLQNNEAYDQARSADAVAETEFTLLLFNKGTISCFGVSALWFCLLATRLCELY